MSEAQAEPVILFVDDDQRVLDGLSTSLRRMRKTWRMEFLCGGAAAALRLGSARADAVVTDMRMPVTDGEGVLTVAREHWPGALRIILSGQTERAVVHRTLRIAHQFLAKPCSVDELRECLQGLLAFATPLDDRTRDVVLGVGDLPVQAPVLSELRELGRKPAVAEAEIVALIERDAALAAQVLHVASAGFYAKRQSVGSIAGAVRVLGAETIFDVLSSLQPCSPGLRGTRLLRRSVVTGQLLGRMLDDEQARLCAALHGLGKVVLLARFADHYAELLERAEHDPRLGLAELERQRFGMSHDIVGAQLLGLWGVPRAVVDAERYASDPEAALRGSPLARALHVASVLTPPEGQLDERLRALPEIESQLPILRGWASEIDAQKWLGLGPQGDGLARG